MLKARRKVKDMVVDDECILRDKKNKKKNVVKKDVKKYSRCTK
jgi:hypothetical protein